MPFVSHDVRQLFEVSEVRKVSMTLNFSFIMVHCLVLLNFFVANVPGAKQEISGLALWLVRAVQATFQRRGDN